MPCQPPTRSKTHYSEEPAEAPCPLRRGAHVPVRCCALANPALHHSMNCFAERGARWGITQKGECKSRARFESGWRSAEREVPTWCASLSNAKCGQREGQTAACKETPDFACRPSNRVDCTSLRAGPIVWAKALYSAVYNCFETLLPVESAAPDSVRVVCRHRLPGTGFRTCLHRMRSNSRSRPA
jgi:hypothetical protein